MYKAGILTSQKYYKDIQGKVSSKIMKNQPAFNEWQLYQIINYTHLQNTIVPLYYLAINCKSNITQHTLYPGFTTFECHASGN